jgi:hypothetical protein
MSNSSKKNGSHLYREIKEIRVNLVEDQWGYIDRLLIWPQIEEADLFDLKTGIYEVEPAEKNLQTGAYTSGVFDAVPWIKKVRSHIIQPHLNLASDWTFTRENDYDRLKNQTMAIIVNARTNAGKIYNPGWAQCRFCGNKAECAALRDFAFQLVPAYESDFVVPEPVHPSEVTSDETLNRMLIFARVMQKWCDSVSAHITALAREGHEYRNFRLIELAGVREVIRPIRVWELLHEKGWTLEEYLACCEIHMGKIDEKISEKTPKGQKKHAVEQFSLLLQDEMAMDRRAPTYQMRARPPKALEQN